MKVDRIVAGMSMPRSNGELVFDAPWQSRAFGLAVALSDVGVYAWSDFSRELGVEIAAGESDDASRYYEHWLAALERLLIERFVIATEDLVRRSAAIADSGAHEHDN